MFTLSVSNGYTGVRAAKPAGTSDFPALRLILCRSGDDSVLESFWEEYKFQVQREQSYAFEVYETCIRDVCRTVAEEMPEEEKSLIWLFTDEWFDWDEEEVIAPASVINAALENSFYSQVFDTACDEELVRDPEDEELEEEEEEDDPDVDAPEEDDLDDA